MMDKDQQVVVSKVYRKFFEEDTQDFGWDEIDDQMSHLDYLADNQLAIESAVILQLHQQGTPTCNQDHPLVDCFIPLVIEAVTYILDLYMKTEHMPNKSRFILQYYLALSQVGYIKY